MNKLSLLFLGSALFLIGCNGGSGGGGGSTAAPNAVSQTTVGSLEYYRKFFYRKIDSCPTEPVIHHEFLNIDPVMLPEEEYGRKTFGASELYINEDGTYGLRYEEMDIPERVEEADLPPLWHTRREGNWSIDDKGQLVLEGLGYLEPWDNSGKNDVKFTYTNAVAAEGVVGQTTTTRMYNSIIGLNDEIIMCENVGDSDYEPVLTE